MKEEGSSFDEQLSLALVNSSACHLVATASSDVVHKRFDLQQMAAIQIVRDLSSGRNMHDQGGRGPCRLHSLLSLLQPNKGMIAHLVRFLIYVLRVILSYLGLCIGGIPVRGLSDQCQVCWPKNGVFGSFFADSGLSSSNSAVFFLLSRSRLFARRRLDRL